MRAGEGVTVSGSGSPTSPYLISSPLTGQLQVTDTPTVDLTLTGDGSAVDPYTVAAAAKLDPADGNVLTAGPGGLRVACADVVACTAPSAPVTVGCGLEGNGSAALPIQVLGVQPWPYPCPQAQGARVYCANNGHLLVDPPDRCVTAEIAQGVDTALDNFCTRVPNTNVETLLSTVPNRLTVTNPDPCRAMVLNIEAGGYLRMHGDGTDGLWLNALVFHLVVNNVDRGVIERLAVSGQGGTVSRFPTPFVTVPAAGKVTLGSNLYGASLGGCHVDDAAYQHPRIKVTGRTCV